MRSRTERLMSVCTGAFVLAEAGLLDGRRATSHLLALQSLRELGGALPASERVVIDGKYMTAAVSRPEST